MKHLSDLSEKVAIITGGAGVLGSAIAKGLAEYGVKVAILGISKDSIEQMVTVLAQGGAEVFGLVANVLDQEQLEAARNTIVQKWGKVDILINCAGGNRAGATILPEQNFFDLSIDDLDAVTALNFKGTILPILVFGQEMARQRQGSIINISSMAAARPLTRVFGYSASKAAIDNATKWLAVEMIHKFGTGIRVNAIAPGFFVGEQNRDLLYDSPNQLSARGKTIIEHTPMGRFGNPEDLCGVVNWLCSDSAAFVTGTIIPIDGGFSAFSGI